MSDTSAAAVDEKAIQVALDNARAVLLQRASAQGHWVGHLSNSALSTAVAIVALSWMDAKTNQAAIENGLRWLAQNQGADGGWGDTPDSPSNPSTTLLCWAAFNRGPANLHEDAIRRAEVWLNQRVDISDASRIAERVIALYGRDHTFSVPILTLCALCGRLGESPHAWEHIPQLPFELAALPHQLFQWLRLPVVSYAIPALIAIGLVRHEHMARRFCPFRIVRERLKPRVLEVLRKIQPSSGGFLEAVPLTGFVVMALAASGQKQHPVAINGARFLLGALRADGSWPIDVNLSTWLTTLAVGALCVEQTRKPKLEIRKKAETRNPKLGVFEASNVQNIASEDPLPIAHQQSIINWLLKQQHAVEHPFTHAAPGGWAWTDLPGGVPDADDTAGALLALHTLDAGSDKVRSAAERGVKWLLDLQNRDGGIPTFCRGWLNLPFDRSCPDITAHALSAWIAWRDQMPARLQNRIDRVAKRALGFLCKNQHPDGTWVPLWFGNQHAPRQHSPLYGTARVLLSLQQLPPSLKQAVLPAIARGRAWLISAQQPDGGWGGSQQSPASVEETALALDALSIADLADNSPLVRGVRWLLQATQNGTQFPPSPIGLYFARLWYSEELYPIIFSSAALGRIGQGYYTD